ncbi:IS5 family transposase [Desulfolithobacter dissulfuricans]|uniref:IS5 family transposase n=1 Tax=Desulfolithobacter dissulfuricans TaxID=2795293 RepID=A0A915U1X9_9BACT|nr:IS5 family transposase [Desulfolithobacter dissulfuricans]BCO09285.1 IS5 family transposase [Desulfolithobacter dissulfuricans]BCO09437.1 IS5 family transposase [Desulfolithobacter dissulfuricans]
MRPRLSNSTPQGDLFRSRLENILDRTHELYRLAELLPWEIFEKEFGTLYSEKKGRPGIPIRLLAGLTYLGHAFGLSDEEVVRRWVENPYWQFFCGESYFQHHLPIDPSSMSRWRKRIGEKGARLILKATIEAGLASNCIKDSSLERVSVDTTVQRKAVTYPTDAKLYNRSRERLVKLARKFDLPLRQSYARLGPKALLKVGRYLHARQIKRARREIKRLKTYLGRVYRDINRKLEQREELRSVFKEELAMAERLLSQERKDKDKLYSLHAPEVECIAKGKAHRKYEFGVKVSVAVTNRDNFVVGMLAEHGNPYDGHTLAKALEQVQELTGKVVRRCYVDRGYRGHGVNTTQVFISGRKRGMTPQMKKELKRRSAIEPVIGHMKADGKLDRNYLKGILGDKINALLCGAGQNIRILLRKLREELSYFLFVSLLKRLGRLHSWSQPLVTRLLTV